VTIWARKLDPDLAWNPGCKTMLPVACTVFVMPEEDRKQVFLVVDAVIRDFKARKTYAQ